MKNPLLRFATAALLSSALGGCMASGQAHVSTSASAPDLVYINPNVQVIADYDEPIFYSSNYYWRADGAVWYRSSSYTSGWVRVETAPVAIQQIDRPTAYIHYHPHPVETAASTSAAAKHDGGHDAPERHDEKAEQRRDGKEDHDDKAPKRH